jgi:hypothetical protein
VLGEQKSNAQKNNKRKFHHPERLLSCVPTLLCTARALQALFLLCIGSSKDTPADTKLNKPGKMQSIA